MLEALPDSDFSDECLENSSQQLVGRGQGDFETNGCYP